jgi:Hypothetical glycosyl hydrolase family 15
MDRHALGVAALVAVGVAAACGSSGKGNGAGGDGGAGAVCPGHPACDADASSSGSGSGGTGSSSGGASSSGGGSSGTASSSGGAGSSGGTSSSGGDSGTLPSGRSFPDTWSTVAILTDQLPSGMPAAQQQFAATHYVGTEKQLLPDTQALRAINPDFLVLHYHLAMWQSGPGVDFIINGTSWGNDLSTVTNNETWFWHNANGTTSADRVQAPDTKYLMNVSVQGFADYWVSSLEQQVADGQYDGIMFDSASPSLLQGWCGGTGANQDPRLAGTAAKDTTFAELGNTTWIDAWQTWIGALNTALAAKGIPLIPNEGAFITGWDDTNYALSAGVFSEGFGDPSFAESDWQAATNELLSLAAADKLMILQNYLGAASDVATRTYYLGNYLLVKSHHTYLDYFASGPLEWYPEWKVDLGAPTTPATTQVSDLLSGGVYRRDFAKGSVLVNPSPSSVTVTIAGNQLVPTGGGPVDAAGDEPGSIATQPVTSVTLAATSAAIVLH